MLSNQPARTISKYDQVRSKRIKPKQKTLGAISPTVRQEVRLRSRGICEVRIKCNGAPAVEQAHIRGRRIIQHRTTAEDLRDACLECHRHLDNTGDGAIFKRRLREAEDICAITTMIFTESRVNLSSK